ncbi:uncharacterized protein KY384_002714 [Bacidia gigantensis]|uniref:uncharacterized protein n=1 Tax=Bacidia gigantensis TaxID=2732470 RepID=UPI001D05A898|nr:uncharacterized protein KY384_002714 [Bacidia gigantensis]KAG8532836.1 hypothetical protein KY384_002714 [Bacidia gigantensis]
MSFLSPRAQASRSYRFHFRSKLPASSLSRHFALLPVQTRPFSRSHPFTYPRKDSQDKDSINTESSEYSKSGTDDAASGRNTGAGDTAFDPDVTDPQAEYRNEGGNVSDSDARQDSQNPLNVSPANPDVSAPRDEQEGGAEASSGSLGSGERARSSGGGSPSKGKSVS